MSNCNFEDCLSRREATHSPRRRSIVLIYRTFSKVPCLRRCGPYGEAGEGSTYQGSRLLPDAIFEQRLHLFEVVDLGLGLFRHYDKRGSKMPRSQRGYRSSGSLRRRYRLYWRTEPIAWRRRPLRPIRGYRQGCVCPEQSVFDG